MSYERRYRDAKSEISKLYVRYVIVSKSYLFFKFSIVDNTYILLSFIDLFIYSFIIGVQISSVPFFEHLFQNKMNEQIN